MTCWVKIGAERGLENSCKINNVVTILNDMKNVCCLDLKCFFHSVLHRIFNEYV